jgi:hypothetical protein
LIPERGVGKGIRENSLISFPNSSKQTNVGNCRKTGKRNSHLEDTGGQTYHPQSNLMRSGDTGGDYLASAADNLNVNHDTVEGSSILLSQPGAAAGF